MWMKENNQELDEEILTEIVALTEGLRTKNKSESTARFATISIKCDPPSNSS